MSGQHWTKSKYALQFVVVLFDELLVQLAEAGLTRTYQDVFRLCELKTIDYLVLRYLHNGTPPFGEWAKAW
jgi:hypothetical protein